MQWLRRRRDALRLAQADAEALIRDHGTEAYSEAPPRARRDPARRDNPCPPDGGALAAGRAHGGEHDGQAGRIGLGNANAPRVVTSQRGAVGCNTESNSSTVRPTSFGNGAPTHEASRAPSRLCPTLIGRLAPSRCVSSMRMGARFIPRMGRFQKVGLPRVRAARQRPEARPQRQ